MYVTNKAHLSLICCCCCKFADDTTVIGLITDNDETAYREEVSTLTKWCQENHLSLNIDKTKELVVDYRRQSREHTPITIDKTPVEQELVEKGNIIT